MLKDMQVTAGVDLMAIAYLVVKQLLQEEQPGHLLVIKLSGFLMQDVD